MPFEHQRGIIFRRSLLLHQRGRISNSSVLSSIWASGFGIMGGLSRVSAGVQHKGLASLAQDAGFSRQRRNMLTAQSFSGHGFSWKPGIHLPQGHYAWHRAADVTACAAAGPRRVRARCIGALANRYRRNSGWHLETDLADLRVMGPRIGREVRPRDHVGAPAAETNLVLMGLTADRDRFGQFSATGRGTVPAPH